MVGLLFALAACAHLPQTSQNANSYAIGARYPLGGAGRWDLLAVDSGRHHLFLTRSDRVDIVDTNDGRLVATLAGTDGVHGIAIAPALHRGFTTNGKSDSVTEFDLVTLQRVRDIKVSGHSPDAILFDAFSRRVFVFNAHSNNASVIDPANGMEIATIAFPGNPELGVSDGKGHVYVNIEDKAELAEIDATSLQVLQTWPLPGCEEPSGLAMDIVHARLFSVCQNHTMAITDANSGRQVARIAIDEGADGAAFDPERQLAFSPNGKSGTLTVVHEDDPEHFRAIQTVATQSSARTIAIDPATHRLYLPAAHFEKQPEGSKERPPMLPDSFVVLVVWGNPQR
jgi:YVTN family beta-propeller protein